MSTSGRKGASPDTTGRPKAGAQKPNAAGNPSIAPSVDPTDSGTGSQRRGARSDSRTADYEVGYCRPPRQHQFKAGQSGNPRGRPKGIRSEADILKEVLNKTITIQERGRTRKISVLEAIYHRIAQNSIKGGDYKAATFLVNRVSAVTQGSHAKASEMNEDDREVLEAYVSQMMDTQKRGSGT